MSHIDPAWLDIAHQMAHDLIRGRPVQPTRANASAMISMIHLAQIQMAEAEAEQQAEPEPPSPAPDPQQQRRQWRRKREEI